MKDTLIDFLEYLETIYKEDYDNEYIVDSFINSYYGGDKNIPDILKNNKRQSELHLIASRILERKIKTCNQHRVNIFNFMIDCIENELNLLKSQENYIKIKRHI